MKRPNDDLNEIIKDKKSKLDSNVTQTPERLELERKLSEMIRHKKKYVMKKSKIILSLNDLKSFDKSLEDNDKSEWTLPQFFVHDIQRVILFSLIGNKYRFFPRWCKILRPNFIKSVNLIVINNLSEFDYKLLEKKFKKINKIFTNQKNEINSIEIVSPNANGNNFLNEFVSVPITHSQWLKIRDEPEFDQKRREVVEQYRQLFQSLKSKKELKQDTSDLDKIPRTSLLLNIIQMIREDYPLPFDSSSTDKLKDYIYSKQSYSPVTDKSPLYSIDCEMCVNIDGEMEVVWLAIANENLECVYETFVKPKKKIQNFITHITGVSSHHLENVLVDLTQVQQKIQEILPSDAILCGQSLNNDLHALKMFHPYVIDTSIIYNISGNRDIKPSLRRLTAQFLGKLIQESTHNPTIDAKASLQLVLLKLRQGLDFGDVIINGCTNVYKQDESIFGDMCLENTDLSNVNSISKFIYQTGLNIDQNFFKVLIDNSISNVYIDRKIKNKKTLKNATLSDVENNDEAFMKLSKLLNNTRFTWTQFYMNTSPEVDLKEQIDKKELKKVLNYIEQVHEKLNDDSMLLVVLSGRINSKNNLNKFLSSNNDLNLNDLDRGRCFLTIKNKELDKMELEIKELYDTIYPNGKKDDLGVVLPDDE